MNYELLLKSLSIALFLSLGLAISVSAMEMEKEDGQEGLNKALINAIKKCNVKDVEKYLKMGACANYQYEPTYLLPYSVVYSPLYCAVLIGLMSLDDDWRQGDPYWPEEDRDNLSERKYKVIKLLLEYGADTQSENSTDNNTPSALVLQVQYLLDDNRIPEIFLRYNDRATFRVLERERLSNFLTNHMNIKLGQSPNNVEALMPCVGLRDQCPRLIFERAIKKLLEHAKYVEEKAAKADTKENKLKDYCLIS